MGHDWLSDTPSQALQQSLKDLERAYTNFFKKRHKKCVECGFAANADFLAACNIREAGLRLLSLSQSSGEVSPSCEEPTEGIPA